jgi:hypothetical protein
MYTVRNRLNNPSDMISSKLPALQAYQLSLAAPAPPAGSFNAAAAQRGRAVFEGPDAARPVTWGTCSPTRTSGFTIPLRS